MELVCSEGDLWLSLIVGGLRWLKKVSAGRSKPNPPVSPKLIMAHNLMDCRQLRCLIPFPFYSRLSPMCL